LFVYPNSKVGINTQFAGEALTVIGNISSNQVVYSENSNSNQWSTAYEIATIFQSVSSNLGTKNTREIKTTSFSAVAGGHYMIDTTIGTVTANLPSPNLGDSIYFKDPFLTWNLNNFIINNNGAMIQGAEQPLLCNINGIGLSLTYIGSNVGWRIE
jgi:hypothetical protein